MDMDFVYYNYVYPFLPHLPPLFELVQEFTITYRVYGKELDGVEVPSLRRPVSHSYLDFTSDSVTNCAEYEFVVQAVTNISLVLPSQNSSAVSGDFISGSKCVHLSS